MKIDRLIGILAILLQKQKVTAPYLAEKFEVSRRTINRDIEALCKAGIPIFTKQGSHGGISIMENYKIDKTLLTSKEMKAILSGLQSLDSISGNNKYQVLMNKLSLENSERLTLNNQILINLSSWYKTSLTQKIETIQAAIDKHHLISFPYYSPNGESNRQIEPYLLVFEWSSWYVWGYCYLRNKFRLFKLNRMGELKDMNKIFTVRNIEEFSINPHDNYKPEKIRAVAIFDSVMKWRLVEEFGLHSFEDMQDGRLRMEIFWSDKESLFSWLLGFREYVKIVEPKEYLEEFTILLNKILERYKQS